MSIINDIRSYIFEDDLKITVLKNKINIVNYTDIGHFDSNRVLIKANSVNIIINGIDLVVSKLINDEVLITGKFKSIEFR